MILRPFLGLLALLSMISCKNDSKTTTNQSVTIPFLAKSGSQDISCQVTLKNLGRDAVDATLKDFRFYIHDLKLLAADGQEFLVNLDNNSWQSENLALLDFQDREDNCGGDAKLTHTSVTGSVAGGASFTGLSFKLGVPVAFNHIDQASAKAPLDVASLFWSWQTGYKFLRADFAPVGGITRPSDPDYSGTTFNIHLGSTGCLGDPELGESVSCERLNVPSITLSNFNLGTSSVAIDLAALVKGIPLSLDEAETPGCMSGAKDPECQAIFENLGLDLASGSNSSSTVQSVFSLK